MKPLPGGMIGVLQEAYNKGVFFCARWRARCWGLFLKRIGKDVSMLKGVLISSPAGVEIGDNTILMQNVALSGEGGLKIGDFVMLAAYARVQTSNHGYEDFKRPMMRQPLLKGPVVIEDDVWLGTRAVVLPNVRIGRGAIVAANSLVTKDVKPYSIVCGVPARFAGYRFEEGRIHEACRVELRH